MQSCRIQGLAALIVLAFSLTAWPHVALAQTQQDGAGWPQFRGPNVDGISPERRVFSNLNEFGLEVVWKKEIGSGYSGVTITNGLGVTMFEAGNSNVVVAFDSESGQEKWRFEIGRRHQGLNGSYDGPISTPLIVGNIVVALDPRGRLVGLDVLAGELVWSLDLPAELDSKRPEWANGTSSILFDATVIVQIGAPDVAVAGLDPATGKRLWTVGADEISYQTPVPVSVNGRRQALATGQKKLMAIDPAMGALLWEYAHGGGGVSGAATIVPVPGHRQVVSRKQSPFIRARRAHSGRKMAWSVARSGKRGRYETATPYPYITKATFMASVTGSSLVSTPPPERRSGDRGRPETAS